MGHWSRSACVAAAASLLVALTVAPASAAITCNLTPAGTLEVDLTAHDDDVGIVRQGNEIVVGAATCTGGTPTVTNTELIDVSGAAGEQSLVISLSGGRFAPGKTLEASGKSEIEFNVDLGNGLDSLRLEGTNQADIIRIGAQGFNLTNDNDRHITMANLEDVEVRARNGNDVVSAGGGKSTGSALPQPVDLEGENGNDQLTGSLANDLLSGGDGADVLRGGLEFDTLNGGEGPDVLDGGGDDDEITPGTGNDKANGGDGEDSIHSETAADGSDDFRGGAGIDSLYYEQRIVAVRVDLDGKKDDGRANEKDNARPDLESVIGGSGNDTLTGGPREDELLGREGEDKLFGLKGDDQLRGDENDDILDGGPGSDDLEGADGFDTLKAGEGHDRMTGGTGNDTMTGGTGNDFFDEGASNSGADQMRGGLGLTDSVYYGGRANPVTVTLDGNGNDGQNISEFDNVFPDVEVAHGGAGGDFISSPPASQVANLFFGNGGIDDMDGGGGSDSIRGGPGGDDITGDDGQDFLFGEDDGDTLHATDGGADTLNGGNGTDVCTDRDNSFDSVTLCP